MLTNILNKLYEYSNIYIDIIVDNKLKIPSFSYIEADKFGRIKPLIKLNPYLFPRNENILAYILAQEWGQHYLKYVLIDQTCLSKLDKEKNDKNIDEFANEFIKIYGFI